MKSVKELMVELGFDKTGSEDTQKAFIKHLIKEAARAESLRAENPIREEQKVVPQYKAPYKEPEQLSFNLPNAKRVS